MSKKSNIKKSPRKFSDKIALIKQKEAVTTACFESAIQGLSEITMNQDFTKTSTDINKSMHSTEMLPVSVDVVSKSCSPASFISNSSGYSHDSPTGNAHGMYTFSQNMDSKDCNESESVQNIKNPQSLDCPNFNKPNESNVLYRQTAFNQTTKANNFRYMPNAYGSFRHSNWEGNSNNRPNSLSHMLIDTQFHGGSMPNVAMESMVNSGGNMTQVYSPINGNVVDDTKLSQNNKGDSINIYEALSNLEDVKMSVTGKKAILDHLNKKGLQNQFTHPHPHHVNQSIDERVAVNSPNNANYSSPPLNIKRECASTMNDKGYLKHYSKSGSPYISITNRLSDQSNQHQHQHHQHPHPHHQPPVSRNNRNLFIDLPQQSTLTKSQTTNQFQYSNNTDNGNTNIFVSPDHSHYSSTKESPLYWFNDDNNGQIPTSTNTTYNDNNNGNTHNTNTHTSLPFQVQTGNSGLTLSNTANRFLNPVISGLATETWRRASSDSNLQNSLKYQDNNSLSQLRQTFHMTSNTTTTTISPTNVPNVSNNSIKNISNFKQINNNNNPFKFNSINNNNQPKFKSSCYPDNFEMVSKMSSNIPQYNRIQSCNSYTADNNDNGFYESIANHNVSTDGAIFNSFTHLFDTTQTSSSQTPPPPISASSSFIDRLLESNISQVDTDSPMVIVPNTSSSSSVSVSVSNQTSTKTSNNNDNGYVFSSETTPSHLPTSSFPLFTDSVIGGFVPRTTKFGKPNIDHQNSSDFDGKNYNYDNNLTKRYNSNEQMSVSSHDCWWAQSKNPDVSPVASSHIKPCDNIDPNSTPVDPNIDFSCIPDIVLNGGLVNIESERRDSLNWTDAILNNLNPDSNIYTSSNNNSNNNNISAMGNQMSYMGVLNPVTEETHVMSNNYIDNNNDNGDNNDKNEFTINEM